MALDQRGTKFTGIISLRGAKVDDGSVFEFNRRLFDVFSMMGLPTFAFCGHWQDLNEDGETETPHVHFYITSEKQIRIGTLINKIAKSLDLSTLAISMQIAQSYEGCLQYLIHKTQGAVDKGKTQHNAGEIVSNINEEELALALERPTELFNVDFILSCWHSCHNYPEFVKMIGIERYRLYRNVIKDLIDRPEKSILRANPS